MLIAQVTDTHLGFDPDNPAEFNRKRLDQVIRILQGMQPQPDVLLLTGDLADRGDSASYRRLANALGNCPFPVWPIVGNHDDRANFLKHFPQVDTVDGFVQYQRQCGPLRMLFLDTLEPGRHGGAFCAARAAWLDARLKEAPDTPTLIVMHHPPTEIGIPWMDTHSEELWVQRLAQAMKAGNAIIGIVCGHVHRAISIGWQQKTVSICASTAPQVALDLRPIDPEAPDGRAMIVADPPGYALHFWNGTSLVTHFETVDDHVLLARYDSRMQPLVRDLLSERPQLD